MDQKDAPTEDSKDSAKDNQPPKQTDELPKQFDELSKEADEKSVKPSPTIVNMPDKKESDPSQEVEQEQAKQPVRQSSGDPTASTSSTSSIPPRLVLEREEGPERVERRVVQPGAVSVPGIARHGSESGKLIFSIL